MDIHHKGKGLPGNKSMKLGVATFYMKGLERFTGEIEANIKVTRALGTNVEAGNKIFDLGKCSIQTGQKQFWVIANVY